MLLYCQWLLQTQTFVVYNILKKTPAFNFHLLLVETLIPPLEVCPNHEIFDELEFQCFVGFFDPQSDEVINGYDFMIAFIRLGAMRKSRESLEVREKQELFLIQQREEEERKQLEKEKKIELAAAKESSAAA